MANNVIVQVLGGKKQVLDNVDTVGEVKKQLDAGMYTASVDGETVGDDTVLDDGQFVSLAEAVKGGN